MQHLMDFWEFSSDKYCVFILKQVLIVHLHSLPDQLPDTVVVDCGNAAPQVTPDACHK